MTYQPGTLWKGDDRMDKWYSSITGREPDDLPIKPSKPVNVAEALYPGYKGDFKFVNDGKYRWYYDGAGDEPDFGPSFVWGPVRKPVTAVDNPKKTNPVETLLLALKGAGGLRKRRASQIRPALKISTTLDLKDAQKPKKLLKKNPPKPQAVPVDFKPETPHFPAPSTPLEERARRYNAARREAEEEAAAGERRIAASRPENQPDTIAFAQVQHSQSIPTPTIPQSNTLGTAHFQFSQAGVDLTTKDHIENYLASIGTGLAGTGQFVLEESDQLEDAEKAAATADFYDGDVEESPGPYHAPIVDETSGYSNIREGLEEFPKQWTSPPEQKLKYYTLEEANAILQAVTYGPDDGPDESMDKVILEPKSQMARLEKMKMIGSWVGSIDNEAGYKQIRKMYHNGDYRNPCVTPNAKKRHARDSFVTKSTYAQSNHSDDSVQYICTKKVRVEGPRPVSPAAPASNHITPVGFPITQVVSPITISSDGEPELDSTVNPAISSDSGEHGLDNTNITSPITISSDDESEPDTFDHTSPTSVSSDEEVGSLSVPNKKYPDTRVFPPGVFAFPGQFRGIGTEERVINGPKSEKGIHLTMGDVLHANYLFVHTNFHACSDADKINWNKVIARRQYDFVDHGFSMTERSAKMPRNKSQENLRREAHLECAAARLEGVAVGQYRYYQGHLNIEEYRDAKICICWDTCLCSKMCSRFGDLICPCSEHITLEEQ